MTAVVVSAGVLGALIGSFLNVVVWRVPRAESVVSPPSACPGCGTRIRPWDNVPVLSWLVLRGRCRDCRGAISVRYPLVELGTAVLFVLVVLRLGVTPELPAYLYLAAVAVALALIDIDVRRLPDAIVLPSYVVVGVLLAVAAAVGGDWPALLRAGVGGAALWLLYLTLALLRPGGMGLGDVKLAGVLGAATAWFGWGAFAVGSFVPFLVGGAYGLVLMALRRAGRRSAIPFGPFMLVGAAVGIAAGEDLAAWYLDLMLG